MKEVVLLHLWHVNVKTTRGFFYIPLEDLTWLKPRHINIKNCTIIVDRPRQNQNSSILRLRQKASSVSFSKHDNQLIGITSKQQGAKKYLIENVNSRVVFQEDLDELCSVQIMFLFLYFDSGDLLCLFIFGVLTFFYSEIPLLKSVKKYYFKRFSEQMFNECEKKEQIMEQFLNGRWWLLGGGVTSQT